MSLIWPAARDFSATDKAPNTFGLFWIALCEHLREETSRFTSKHTLSKQVHSMIGENEARCGEPPDAQNGPGVVRPPSLYSIVADSEKLQPSQAQLDKALGQSSLYWRHMAAAAEFDHEQGITSHSVNPHNMLRRVPRMRGNPRETYAVPLGTPQNEMLCFCASTSWGVNGSTDCSGLRKDKSHTILLHIGTKIPVPFTLNGDRFRHWVGTSDEREVGPNYLAILVLGWCYILSARLAELQGGGQVDTDILSWWLAILASDQGWRAVIKEGQGGDFLAPWTMKNIDKQQCSVKWEPDETVHKQCSRPLSSSEAFAALAHFALLHNLGSQFLVALASAITIPTHNSHGSTVHLPRPSATGGQCSASSTAIIPSEWAALHENLDYYITLGCNPETVISSLCGMFWEPGVPCNLVSPWLHPILTEMPEHFRSSGSPDRHAEILAIICGIRRPSISALWLGAVISGLTPIILLRAQKGRPPLDPVAFPWTGAPQSFMDVPGEGPYCIGESKTDIWRADVWRLLHLPTDDEDDLSYNYPPRTPWEPCGKMSRSSCALRVASHLFCSRHRLSYQHLNWELQGCPTIHDRGRSEVNPIPSDENMHLLPIREQGLFPNALFSQEASEQASLEVFRWFVINGEGFPSEEIYKSEWLEPLQGDEDSDEEVGHEADHENDTVPDTLQTGKRHGLEQWLDTVG